MDIVNSLYGNCCLSSMRDRASSEKNNIYIKDGDGSFPASSSFQADKRVSLGIKLRVSPLITLSLSFWISISLALFLYAYIGRMDGEGRVSAGNEQQGRFKRICVFCGSRAGYKSAFSDAAVKLGKLLVERRIDLVYGGGSLGLMGLISQTVLNGGCHVLGVIPKALLPREISGETFGEVKTVADMHERKSIMAKHADAFIALPGGYGTMEELLEVIAWSQLGIHDKPVGLLNVDGYFNSLLTLFDKGVEEGFIENSARHIVVIADTAVELIKKMEEYVPVHGKVAPRQSWEVDQLLEPTPSGEPLGS